MKDDKVFDMKPPGDASAHASGRPVIVGHHPTMTDPMLRPMTHGHQPTPARTPQHQPQPHPNSVPPGTPILPGGEPFLPPTPVAPPQLDPTPEVPTQPLTPTAEGSFTPIAQDLTGQSTATPPATASTFTQPTPAPEAAQQPAPTIPGQTQNQPLTDQVQHAAHHELPITEKSVGSSRLKKILLMVVLPVLLIGAGTYLVLDAQLVDNQVKLPYEFFKDGAPINETTSTTVPTQSDSSQVNIVPPGYSAYNDSSLPFSFNYPTSWGTPTVTTEQGFSKRGGNNKSDGTYAYLVGFASNKDVQMAITSTKYLPPARGTLYYDYLSWCVNPADNKIYKSILAFTSSGGVDTATQPTCNQGPLTDATKIDATTIVQSDTKSTDGSSLGDVYTKNLGNANIAVVRVKDASRKNGADIKIILNNDLASSANSTSP